MATSSKTVWGFKPPKSSHILIIILLGAIGFVATLSWLTHDVRLRDHAIERWQVTATNVELDKASSANDTITHVVDSVLVEIRPQLADHKATAKKVSVNLPRSWSYSFFFLNYNPTFLVWMALFSTMMALSLAFIPVMFAPIRALFTGFGIKRKHLFVNLVVLGVIFACLMITLICPRVTSLTELMEKGNLLLKHPQALVPMIILATFSGLLGIMGQLMVNHAVDGLAVQNSPDPATAARLLGCRFDALKKLLKLYLVLDAVLIVFTIITTDTLSRSILNEVSVVDQTNFKIMPQEFVYLYGLGFTLYLALLYLPIQYRLRITGEALLDNLDKADSDNKDLVEKLTVKETPLESFKVALSILAPLATSLIPMISLK